MTFTVMQNTVAEAVKCYNWTRKNRPHLIHLACYAKKGRNRIKNRRRIIREYYREARHGQE